MNISERLRQIMIDKALSYGQLSELTGLSKSSLQRYATGNTRKIPLEVIELIENVLHLEKGYLLGWTPEEQKEDISLTLTPKEEKLVINYREKPAMQKAVDTLLGIED